MFDKNSYRKKKKGSGGLATPANPLYAQQGIHHSLILKQAKRVANNPFVPNRVFAIIRQMTAKKIDWLADQEVMKALNLDPSKIKVKKVKSKGYDEEFLCIGVGSRQRSGRHILFLDLDGNTKEQAERVAKSLISSVGCSDCYIVQSSVGNHHLVCLDIFFFSEVQEIARDFGHDQWARFRGNSKDFVLRIGPKMRVMKRVMDDAEPEVFLEEVDGTQPKLVSVIHSPFKYRSKSNSMRRIFSAVWGFNIKKDNGFTDSTMFRFHCYRVRLRKHKNGIDKQVKFEQRDNLKPAVKKSMAQSVPKGRQAKK